MAPEPVLRALLPRHGSRNSIAAVTAFRLFTRTRSFPTLPDPAVVVGLRCGTVDPQIFFLATRWRSIRDVGRPTLKHRDFLRGLIRCLLAMTANILSVFPIKEESTRCATSSPFSERHNVKDPPRVNTILPRCPSPTLEDAHRVLRTRIRILIRQTTCFRLSLPQWLRNKIRHCATGQW